jgi:hypothetical protein
MMFLLDAFCSKYKSSNIIWSSNLFCTAINWNFLLCLWLNWQFSSCQEEQHERKNIANFSHVWNEFIYSLRMEDLISNQLRLFLLYNLLQHQVHHISSCKILNLLHCSVKKTCYLCLILQVMSLSSSGLLFCLLARYVPWFIGILNICTQCNSNSNLFPCVDWHMTDPYSTRHGKRF